VSDILSKVVGKTEHHVKNSKDLTAALMNLTLEEHEMLNSHNLMSLFISTPVDKAFQVIKKSLHKDES